MRDRIVRELGDLAHPQFLVYLMGPYRASDLGAVLGETDSIGEGIDPEQIPEHADFGTLVDSEIELDRDEAVLDLLLSVRDRLRTDPGVNAFLAIDVDVPLEEIDAATQRIEFALASNAIAYIVPAVGDKLGVGIEAGSVIEAIYREETSGSDDDRGTTRRERVVFAHESSVDSAMITGLSERWEARVYTYNGRDELVEQLRLFVRDIARRELVADLPRIDGECY